MMVAPNGELRMRSESGLSPTSSQARASPKLITAGNPVYRLNVILPEDESGALEACPVKLKVSSEETAELLDQLQVEPDTRVLLDIRKGTDLLWTTPLSVDRWSWSGSDPDQDQGRRLHTRGMSHTAISAHVIAEHCGSVANTGGDKQQHIQRDVCGQKKRRLTASEDPKVRGMMQALLESSIVDLVEDEHAHTDSGWYSAYSMLFWTEKCAGQPELSRGTHVSDVKVLVTTTGEPVQVESSQMVVAPNGELRVRPEASSSGGAMIKAANPVYRLRVVLPESGAPEMCPWKTTISAADAEGVLDQLEAAPDTQVVIDVMQGEEGGPDGQWLVRTVPASTEWWSRLDLSQDKDEDHGRRLHMGGHSRSGGCKSTGDKKWDCNTKAHWAMYRHGGGARRLQGVTEHSAGSVPALLDIAAVDLVLDGHEHSGDDWSNTFFLRVWGTECPSSMSSELGVDGDARRLGTTMRSSAFNLRVDSRSARRLQASEPGAVLEDSWELDVSAADAKGLLNQLEAEPDTKVFLVFGDGDTGNDEDPDGQRRGEGSRAHSVHATVGTWHAGFDSHQGMPRSAPYAAGSFRALPSLLESADASKRVSLLESADTPKRTTFRMHDFDWIMMVGANSDMHDHKQGTDGLDRGHFHVHISMRRV